MIHLRLWCHTVLLMSALLTLASCSDGNQQQSQPAALPDNRATDESMIRTIDADWLKAIAGKDAQRSASFYADGGSLLAPGAPLATGKDPVQICCGADQGKVRECLWEVAEMLPAGTKLF